MMTIISLVLFSLVLIRLILFAVKTKWSIFEITAYIIYIPGMLLLMIFGGAVYIALPLIILAGILSFLLCNERSNNKNIIGKTAP